MVKKIYHVKLDSKALERGFDMINVINKKKEKITNNMGFYIGRPSVLGNVYKIGVDGTRDEVTKKYEKWLNSRIRNKDKIIMDILKSIKTTEKKYGSVDLVCWCKPLACHGDVIKKMLDKMGKK